MTKTPITPLTTRSVEDPETALTQLRRELDDGRRVVVLVTFDGRGEDGGSGPGEGMFLSVCGKATASDVLFAAFLLQERVREIMSSSEQD